MTARFVALVSCDNPGCPETAELGVRIDMESGCSPFGGPCCSGSLEVDDPAPYPDCWQDFPDGKHRCPKCWADPLRFEVSP